MDEPEHTAPITQSTMTAVSTFPTVSTSTRNEPRATSTGIASTVSARLLLRPAPAALPAFADVADPELAQAAQWAIEQGYLKARADGSFKPDKGVAKWRVIRGYRAVTEP